MTVAEVEAAVRILGRFDVRFVVIGGQAVAQAAATSTQDVDVMVATDDFGKTVAGLRRESGLAFDWENEQLARFRILPIGGVPLDVINSAAFSGDKPGADFFRYLLEEGSVETDGIPYATPEVVWYTRLMTKRWRAYAEKVVTNVIDGVDPGRLDRVEEIARRFGTDATIGSRLAYVRAELARPDIASLVRRP